MNILKRGDSSNLSLTPTRGEKEDKGMILPISNSETKKKEGHFVDISRYAAFLSSLMYAFFSISLVLSNKAISSTLDPSLRARMPQMSVILYQNILAVFLVETAKLFKFIEYPNFSMATAYSWLPMNALFVSMLCSGFLALCYVSVPMAQTFKNLANIFTVFGDWYFFGETVGILSIVAVFIMTIGAVFAGINDLEFNALGYFWMVVNCCCTAGHLIFFY